MVNADTSIKRRTVHARVDELLDERIENWRRAQPKIPPRSEALRELLERGLDERPDAA
jgi:hypothetical protein